MISLPPAPRLPPFTNVTSGQFFELRRILAAGNARANKVAEATLAEVREAMQMVYA